MFREKLKNDLSGISPDEELLIKVTKAMQEEVQKPRPNIYRRAAYFGGMAAAVCMIAVGAVALGSGIGTSNETMAADSAKHLEMNEASKAAQGGTAEFYFAEAEACEEIPAGDTAGAREDGYTETAEITTSPAAAVADTHEEKDGMIVTLPEFEKRGIYGSYAENPSVFGPPAAYEEIINGRYDEIDSFYRIRITGIIDNSEAAALKGYNIDIDEFAAFYNAVIEYDYISQSEENEEIILRIPGGEYGMNDGCPPYSEGDVIAVVLQKNSQNDDFRRRFSYAFHYDIYEIDGISYAAVREQSVAEAEEGLTDYFGGEIVKYETTAANNPAVYYGLYETEGIAENLRRLFAADRASLSNVLTIYKGENIDLTEQDAQEMISTAEKYMEENSFQLLDLMLSPDDIDEIGRNGLLFRVEYEDGSYTAVYIDGEDSYVCEKFSTYFFGGEDKEYILSFFE